MMKNNEMNIIERITYYKKVMDKSLKYSDERLTLLSEMYNDPVIIDYLSSDTHRKKQIKVKKNFLCESEPLSKLLDEISYYILFPDFKNKQHEQDFKNDEFGTVSNNQFANNISKDDYSNGHNKKIHGYTTISKNKFSKNKSREYFILDLMRKYAKNNGMSIDDIGSDTIMTIIRDNKDELSEKVNIKNQSIFHPVTDSDFVKFPELQQINTYKENLHKRLGFGKSKDERDILFDKLKGEFNHKVNVYKEDDYDYCTNDNVLSEQELKLKELVYKKSEILKNNRELDYDNLTRDINVQIEQLKLVNCEEYNNVFTSPHFQILPTHISIGKGKNRLDIHRYRQLWNEDKYIKTMERVHKEIAGEMIYVKDRLTQPIRFKKIGKNSGVYDYDYSMFSFADKSQVSELFKSYYELKERHFAERNDIWAILNVFDELIYQCNWNKYEKFIINEVKSGATVREIREEFNKCFHKKFVERQIRRFIDEYIPNKIVEKYKESKDEYLFYTYYEFLKPKYKRCSKCGEYKLAFKRYFRERSDKKGDGFYNNCRICEK